MGVIAYLGPTMPVAKARRLADIDYRPPAGMGDITRAAKEKPAAILLVDGVFENGPSVWHKEILWALSQGIPVIGASSMGALRAAELHSFGMRGFGEVFRQFADGVLIDDDEVAVVHGPQEMSWLCLSDAMVDIRHRVESARNLHMISDEEAEGTIAHAKSTHFKDRSLLASLSQTVPQDRATAICKATTSLKLTDCASLLTNLTETISVAERACELSPPFDPTVYLRRLERFGFHWPE